MSRLLADCERLFNTSNLYDLLAVPKSASSSQVKKAYYRLSLTVHPDRVAKNEVKGATEKFQVLGKLYSILSDEEKRRIYDDTGSVDDEEFVSVDRDWSDYWRILFPKVSQRDIEDFEAQYKGSEEEVEDLRRAYVSCDGDMDQILESVLCASVEDEQRFRDILEPLVTSGDLPTFDLFINEPAAKRLARKRKAERERKEAEGEMKKMSKKKKKEEECVGGGDDSLAQLIQARQQSREQQSQDFFAQLEQKYGGAKETKKSNKSSKLSTDKTVSGGKKKKSKNDR